MDEQYGLRETKGWAIVSGALTIATIILLACTSHPDLVQPYVYNSTIGGQNIDKLIPGEKMKRALLAEPHPVIVIMDQTVNIILTLEFMVRFLTCPGKLRFFAKVLNWVDFITFSTYWSFISMFAAFEQSPKDAAYIVTMNVFSALVTIRIFRIFRLAGIFKGLRVLMLLVKKNFKELLTLIMFFMIGMLMFSTMIFFAELHIDDDKFPSIIHGLWWSIITMTTVGYGDIVPSSSTGQMVGAVCALCGILLSGLAIPIISNNFNLYYNYSYAQDEQDEIEGKNDPNSRENGDVPLSAREKAGSRGIRYIYFYEA
ncbi:potassium voltage-gated channel protein egl-36-like isoform X2 [Lineus longissimus]|uniref:potassium voltage-gated channel protein egl-36-like isoform X2 n=1 Tax=Lineus longissimus TaxID=88925 RepID=UPI00315DAB93